MMKAKYIIVLLLFFGFTTQAQEFFHRKNLADIDVNTLTSQELNRFQRQIAATNMTELEMMSYLMEKGLSRTEIANLMRRMDQTSSRLSKPIDWETEGTYNMRDRTDPLINRMYLQSREFPDSLMFGSELFRNIRLDFAPNLQLATPLNYVLGPGDEINITLHGNQEVFTDESISPNGSVTLQYAGVVQVGGLTVEQAEEKIRKILANRGFESLATGGTRLTVSVNEYRSIPITVIGAKMSGNYSVPSVASAFHALVIAGGPHSRGSYREIEVVRRGKIIQHIDLYRFMVHGDRSADVLLEENDVINIPVYENLISIKGEVKRSGFFQLIDGENFNDLLKYAGGFTPLAYNENIYVEQVGAKEFSARDVLKNEFASYQPASGDVIIVGSIANRYQNKVSISGAISRPGNYGWHEGLMLSNLVQRAGGLLESALLSRGLVYRSGRNHENEYLRFVPQQVLEGEADLALMDGDSIIFGDRRRMFPYEFINVVGEVRKVDKYTYGKGMTALDAILLAGGIKQGAIANRIEIARRIEGSNDMQIARIIEAGSDAELILRAEEVELQPLDIVIVKPNPDYMGQQVVYVEGEVVYPGTYVLLRRNERLSSVLKRAGGINEIGDENAVFIIRQNLNPVIQEELKKMGLEDPDSYLALDSLLKSRSVNGNNRQRKTTTSPAVGTARDNRSFSASDPFYGSRSLPDAGIFDVDEKSKTWHDVYMLSDTIAINNVGDLMRKEDDRYDLHLQKDDRVVVLMRNNTVAVKGMVNNELTVNFMGKKLKQYINEAGGTMKSAQKGKIFVIEPNGRARMTRRVFGFRKYPDIVPGSVVVVPEKPETESRFSDPASMAAIASILASATSLAFMISTFNR
jgi:protein involved in polysaccharide export with SLBB domain